MHRPPFRVLVAPDAGRAVRFAELLADDAEAGFEFVPADDLETCLAVLRGSTIDALILGVEPWPKSPFAVFATLTAEAPDAPVLVVVSQEQETLALRLIQLGAHDHLLEEQMHGVLLARALRYAIERQRLLSELARRSQSWQDEADAPPVRAPTPVTARMYGTVPLSEALPDAFARLERRYGDALDRALEQRAYRVEHDLAAALRSIADELGFLRAVPRDVVEIHTRAMSARADRRNARRFEAYTVEGRFLLLELMGYLASHYRAHALRPATFTGGRASAREGTNA